MQREYPRAQIQRPEAIVIATPYPWRIFSIERRVVRSRILVVVRRRRLGKAFDWAKALKEAA
jgi:hypothetical protein